MKTVFPTDEIAHLFAHKRQDNARNSAGNFYFNSDGLFSYGSHFMIAKFAKNEKDEEKLIFTTRSYSNTTAKHLAIARHATSHLDKIYAPYPDKDSEDNFSQWQYEAEAVLPSLLKAKKPEIYLNKIQEVEREVRAYAEFFGVAIPETLLAVFEIQGKEDYAGFAEKKSIAQGIENARIEKENKKRHAKELREFRSGKRRSIYTRNGFDFLRYEAYENENGTSKVNEIIRTSQGLDFPANVCQRFFKVVIALLSKGKECSGNCKFQFAGYDVTEVNAKHIKIGCHTIAIKEVNRIAKELKW